MFGFLLDWWRRRSLAGRAVFRYHTGREWRYGDPGKIWRELLAHADLQPLDEAMRAAWEGKPEAPKVMAALRSVFAAEPLDTQTGRGLTDWEVMALVPVFSAYLEALKKNGVRGPSESHSTDSTASGPAEPPG